MAEYYSSLEKRAALTEEELLVRCNQIRELGGATPLDELLPGIIGNSRQCLIARNLNFNCRVEYRATTVERNQERVWVMILEDKQLYRHLKNTLGWEEIKVYKEIPVRAYERGSHKPIYEPNVYDGVGLQLPEALWCSAMAFDDGGYNPELYVTDEYGERLEGDDTATM